MERQAAVTVGGFGLWAALLLLLWGAPPSAAAGDSQPPSSLTVGVVQLALEPTLEQNREKIAGLIREAKERDCRVVVFPETALYEPPDTPKAEIDAAVAELQAVVNDCDLYCILVGMYHDHDGDRPFNRLLVIDPEGEIIQTYHKMWHDNRSKVAPGLFPIDGVPCAATICADRWIRSVEELPAFAGAKIHFECSDNYDNEWIPDSGWWRATKRRTPRSTGDCWKRALGRRRSPSGGGCGWRRRTLRCWRAANCKIGTIAMRRTGSTSF